MPTTYLQNQTAHQRRSRGFIRRLAGTIRAHAHASHQSRQRAGEAREAREQFEGLHPQFGQVDSRASVRHVVVALCMFAVYGIDVLLFRPTSEYFVRRAFHDSPLMVAVATFVAPALIILLEIYISTQIHLARELMREFRQPAGFYFWLAVAIAFGLVMPAALIATSMAMQAATSPALASVIKWQMVMQVGLAVGAHVAVLAGGELAMDAKSFVYFKARQFALQGRENREKIAAGREARAAGAGFADYVQRLSEHNAIYQHATLQPDMFDAMTRQVLREYFGREVIEDSPQPASNGSREVTPEPQRPDTPPTGGDESDHDAEREYWRTILARRVRENESEVTGD